MTLVTSTLHSDCTCELYRTLRSGEPQTFDIPKLFRKKPVDLLEARAFEIDPVAKVLRLRTETRMDLRYDRLILATGAGRPSRDLEGLGALVNLQNPVEPRIFHARSNQQISELRMALTRTGWMNQTFKDEAFVVVIGGGATGVEIAGEIAALRGKNHRKRVLVVEKSYEPLKPALGSVAHRLLRNQLKEVGIEYFEGSRAVRLDGRHLYLENGQMIPWNLLVMAQGSEPDQKLFEPLGDVWGSSQRLKVGRDFAIEDWPRHHAIGDIAEYPWSGQDLPKTAQVAAQEGVYLADRLAAELWGETEFESFRWQNWGYLVSLGPAHGAGRLGPLSLPVLWGPAVDIAKRGATLRFEAQISRACPSGLTLLP